MTTQDPVREALERLVAPFEAQPEGWRDVMRRAAGETRPARPTRTSRRRLFVLAIAIGIASAASLLGVSIVGGEASVLGRARAAVTVSSEEVLHERIVVATERGRVLGTTEEWIQGAPPHRYRIVYRTVVPHAARYEQAGTLDPNSLRTDVYDTRTNTIQRSLGFGLPTRLHFDPAAAIRDALKGRHARVLGRRKLDGRPVVVIELASLMSDGTGWGVGPGGNGEATVLVDPRTYAPVRIEFRHLSGLGPLFGTPDFGGPLSLIERFSIFERIQATPAALGLTSLVSAHPTAKCLLVPLGLHRPCASAK